MTAWYIKGTVIRSWTNEQKYLALIDFCVKHPYVYRFQQLQKKFRLTRNEVAMLGEMLLLEIKGREARNERHEVKIFIKNNPYLTAQEVMSELDIKPSTLYSIALEIGHRFVTNNTMKHFNSRRINIK